MKVTSISISNFRAFVELPTTELGQINVLIGANNAGKSSVLRALYSIQEGASGQSQDVRIGAGHATIQVALEGAVESDDWAELIRYPGVVTATWRAERQSGVSTHRLVLHCNGLQSVVNQIRGRSPNHFIVPFLSKRKTVTYTEDVREEHALQVTASFQHLAAKLSRIANPNFPSYADYSRACMEILGFVVTAIPSKNGLRPGIYLPDGSTLFIDQLGEGVPNIVGMLADLTSSEGKLILIEEPENDLHPSALKALLDLILVRADSNQFVISTHSNIVLKHLGSHSNSKIFSVRSAAGVVPPEAQLIEIENSPEVRLSVLEAMGYGLSDFELWDGWLILEEASAERIIRDYLIPWFAPKLSRVRTLSARGVNRIQPIFEDYLRLVCFAHLEEVYKNRTWIRVDGDQPGREVVEKLRSKFPKWNPPRFDTFAEENFENYYPQEFDEDVATALALKDKGAKRSAKKDLLDRVLAWLDEDEDRAKTALADSAEEIVEFLKLVEKDL